MSNKLVILFESALIKEQLNALPGRQLMVSMMLVDSLLTTAH